MIAQAGSTRAGVRAAWGQALDPEQVLVATASRRAHRIAAVMLAAGAAVAAYLVARDHVAADWRPSGRLAWTLSLCAAAMLLARGVYLGRPVTVRHALGAVALVLSGIGAHLLDAGIVGDLLVASSGLALMWPLPSRPASASHTLWPLICATRGDPLAAFTMGSSKAVLFNHDHSAAVAYRARLGFAVVSGDPVGKPTGYRALVRDFAAMCADRGWCIIVLNCTERYVPLWRRLPVSGHSLVSVPVGRDVVIDVAGFSLSGRKFRNLRQAVARTRRRGVTTEVAAEEDLTATLRGELLDVMRASRGSGRYERGFSMMLDGPLTGHYPGVLLIVARDHTGTVAAFHRYVTSGSGADVSLDLPWRRPGAPNGIDERLAVDMIDWCQRHGGRRLSLAFAPFPELFDETNHAGLQRVYYSLIRLGDPLIRLESLYRYLRKFHALGARRYVLFPAMQIVGALLVLLSLEFLPHRAERLDAGIAWHPGVSDTGR